MVDTKLVYTDPTGGHDVMITPAFNDLARPGGETDDELITRVISQSIPAGATYREIDGSQDVHLMCAIEADDTAEQQ